MAFSRLLLTGLHHFGVIYGAAAAALKHLALQPWIIGRSKKLKQFLRTSPSVKVCTQGLQVMGGGREGSWLLQGITSLKNEPSPIGFQEPQLLTGVRNWVTTLKKEKRKRRWAMEGEAEVFRTEEPEEEPAQDWLVWSVREQEGLG